MTQKELIESVHSTMNMKMPLVEIVHRIANEIVLTGETSLPAILGRLEPATIAYVHTYPTDISDGPWDI